MKKLLKLLFIGITIITFLYIFVVVFDIPFIADYRNMYIETAMTTGDHQWLATKLFPKGLINEIMSNQVLISQKASNSDMKFENIGEDILKQRELNVGDLDYAGNRIIVNDIQQGIIISEIEGDNYKGKIALIDDPTRVFLGVTDKKEMAGMTIQEMLEKNDAIVGINASGFEDYDGKGSGGTILGLCYSEGEAWGKFTTRYDTIGFNTDNNLIVGTINDWDMYNTRDAVQFSPTLIMDGEQLLEGSAGWGIHPRTIVGQREDGVVFFLIIDGRQVGYSLGITVGECAEIMLSYGAINAGACDGGSSSIMAYNDEIITKCSSPSPVGRRLPNAFLVRRK